MFVMTYGTYLPELMISILLRSISADPWPARTAIPRRMKCIKNVIGYDDCIRGTFDAVAIIDVLYKMPINDWDGFLDRIRQRLKPGGTLLIKEHDPTARIRHSWNRVQERLASALHLTLGESFSYEAPAEFAARLGRHGFSATYQRIDRGYPHRECYRLTTNVPVTGG